MKLAMGVLFLSTLFSSVTFAVDTTGCSVAVQGKREGNVEVKANTIPNTSCWNLNNGGIIATYHWIQKDTGYSQKSNIAFYVAINGSGKVEKADNYYCIDITRYGRGPVEKTFDCTASKMFLFSNASELKKYAYNGNGKRNDWNVEVAVSFDNGTWDSKNGENYRFSF